MKGNYVFPFTSVIGQEKIKKALILNVVNPLIGGVLISGEKGTAKSTLVRGLAGVIKEMEVINLPLNITEDRLIGTIDIEKAITEGKRSLEPGILKNAHGNILYVDEVNLLSEHIVNCLLEVSASGINHVEREGISFSHPSRFVLVGTMNPEEGQLRPNFLDRFGLYLEVKGNEDVFERKEIIKRRLEYEKNPVEYVKKWQEKSEELYRKIIRAKELVDKIEVSESIMNLAAQIAKEGNCAGHRAELVIIETAKAIAAMANRNNINIGDIKEAAEYALPHRMRELPPDVSQRQEDNKIDDKNQENNGEMQEENWQNDNNEERESQEKNNEISEKDQESSDNSQRTSEQKNNQEQDNINNDLVDDIGRIFTVKSLNIKAMDRRKRKGTGKRSRTKTDSRQGRYIRYVFPKDKLKDIAFDATLRAAAPYQSLRDKNGLAVALNRSDFREKLREKRTGSTILFIVDASGSMGAKKRMTAVKGAIVSLLTDAYQKRDKVGMIAFRRKDAEVLLGITRSVELAEKSLKTLPTGGKTPLSAGLLKGYEIIKATKKKDPEMVPVIVLISDGRTNISINGGDPFDEALEVARKISDEGIQTIVIDTEQDFIKLGLAKDIAKVMDAQYYKLEELEAGQIAGAVRDCV